MATRKKVAVKEKPLSARLLAIQAGAKAFSAQVDAKNAINRVMELEGALHATNTALQRVEASALRANERKLTVIGYTVGRDMVNPRAVFYAQGESPARALAAANVSKRSLEEIRPLIVGAVVT